MFTTVVDRHAETKIYIHFPVAYLLSRESERKKESFNRGIKQRETNLASVI